MPITPITAARPLGLLASVRRALRRKAVRRALVLCLGMLLGASCEMWPEGTPRELCRRLAPLFHQLAGGGP